MAEKMLSVLQTYDVVTGERKVLKKFEEHIEAPNWSADGKYLLYNTSGKIVKYDLETGVSTAVDTGDCTRCNNDHVLFLDGKHVAISSGTEEVKPSRVWVAELAGGQPRLITEKMPSYLHGVSPDGKTLAYCAERNGNFDVYTMPFDGTGEEKRLTTAEGLDDGPEYSFDGKTIWFCSVRSGRMQAWKMDPDGANQTQMTFDDANNWFPHISPDNQKIVFVTYYPSEVAPGDHPANKNIRIRMMDAKGGEIKTLIATDASRGEKGGQGTMNVNSWNPESTKFAFVTYEFVEE